MCVWRGRGAGRGPERKASPEVKISRPTETGVGNTEARRCGRILRLRRGAKTLKKGDTFRKQWDSDPEGGRLRSVRAETGGQIFRKRD